MSGFEALWGAAEGVVATEEAVGAIAFALGATLTWSGVSKLLHRRRATDALVAFGLLRRPRRWAGALAGAVELAVAAALVLGPLVTGLLVPAALAACALFTGFVAVAARSLASGRRFQCMCFGDDTVLLSWATVARAAALAALAAVAALGGAGVAPQPSQPLLLEAVVGASAVATAALVGLWPRLRRWQTDPFGLRDELWIQREAS